MASCGEEVETVEHCLLKCPRAEEMWNIAPVKREGLKELRGCFRGWWDVLMEAKFRPEGKKHIDITINISYMANMEGEKQFPVY